MKKNLFAVIKTKVTSFIPWFKSSNPAALPINESLRNYYSLAPVDEAEQSETYFDALLWAIENRKEKNIKNIALTGPYGSGKSSILRTFQAKNRNLQFLNISLATFKEEADINDNIAKNDNQISKNDNLLRLIELSILQQIFYFEEDKKIPDSRFKRIKSQNKWSSIKISLALFIMSLVTLIVLKPSVLKEQLIDIEITKTAFDFIHYISLAFFLIGIGSILYNSARILNSLRLDKLNIQNAEIKVDESVNKSILNHHLDEILYFFEVTTYNVVIIEDLDRFKQTEIFTKLRELNLLINNSKKTKKDVVFIYAVRDDLFTDKDRTKFFDFIIPIIPVINSSNSNEKFTQKIKENRYKISEDLVEDIALFVDDMRLLNNIINEYNIYSLKLHDKLNQNNLFAMIVYKNIHPNDFINLSNGEGDLFKIFARKQEFIKDLITQIDEKMLINENKIEELDRLQIKNILELKSVYLCKYIEKHNNFIGFQKNNIKYSVSQILENDNFNDFKNNSFQNIIAQAQSGTYYYTNILHSNIKFREIEEEVDSNFSYAQREQQIIDWNSKKSESLKRDIERLGQEKIEIKLFKLQEILSKGAFSFEIDDRKQSQLLSILLRNGYINEDYHDYISIFYEGSITKADHNFLLNVKSQMSSEFSHALDRIGNLLKKINEKDFTQSYILNFDLLDYLLLSNLYKSRKEAILKMLANESQISIDFISGYIENGRNVGLFVKEICKHWDNVWNYISNQSNFTADRKENYFSLIINNADINDIKKIAKVSNLVEEITLNKKFLYLSKNTQKLKDIIKTFSIKFEELIIDKDVYEIFDFIYKGNYYEINQKMISLIIKTKGKFNQTDFDTKNYYSINESECDDLVNYIDNELDKYIEKVYLKIENNKHEEESYLIFLLNSDLVNIDNKREIIQKVITRINKLDKIESTNIKDILMEEFKVEVDWSNLIDYFVSNNNVLNERTLNFLNDKDNVAILSDMEIPQDIPSEDICNSFIENLMLKKEISNENYRLLLNSVPYNYNYDFGYTDIPLDKIVLLIDAKKITPNSSNFESLKLLGKKLHIRLIELDYSQFSNDISEFQLNEEDIIDFLSSDKIPNEIKSRIILSVDNILLTNNLKILNYIGKLLLEDIILTKDKEIIKEILVRSSLSDKQKIKIFINKESQFKNDEITEILSSLSSPYSDIASFRKRPLIKDNDENLKLALILEKRRYISKSEIDKNGKGIRISTFNK